MKYKKMNTRIKLTTAGLLFVGVITAAILFLRDKNVAVLNPRGSIAQEQFDLIVLTVLLSLIIVVPVFTLTFYIVWKYRAGNKKAKYSPELHGSKTAEAVWWLVPLALITILSVVIVRSSHDLDPYREIKSDVKPVKVQVVALEWKWLFIYPEYNIATVNYLQIPEDTPINLDITADAPMNSFWIPQLGGQVYAMAGMNTQLHLLADKQGSYNGSSANISGEGFAGMKFTAKATSRAEFDKWVTSAKASSKLLDAALYNQLAKPSEKHAVTLYSGVQKGLYDKVLMKYMMPAEHTPDMDHSNVREHLKEGHH